MTSPRTSIPSTSETPRIPRSRPAPRIPVGRSASGIAKASRPVKIGVVATSTPASDDERCRSPKVRRTNGPTSWTTARTATSRTRPRSWASTPRRAASAATTAAPIATRPNTITNGDSSPTAILISRYGTPQSAATRSSSEAIRRSMPIQRYGHGAREIHYASVSTPHRPEWTSLRAWHGPGSETRPKARARVSCDAAAVTAHLPLWTSPGAWHGPGSGTRPKRPRRLRAAWPLRPGRGASSATGSRSAGCARG